MEGHNRHDGLTIAVSMLCTQVDAWYNLLVSFYAIYEMKCRGLFLDQTHHGNRNLQTIQWPVRLCDVSEYGP